MNNITSYQSDPPTTSAPQGTNEEDSPHPPFIPAPDSPQTGQHLSRQMIADTRHFYTLERPVTLKIKRKKIIK